MYVWWGSSHFQVTARKLYKSSYYRYNLNVKTAHTCINCTDMMIYAAVNSRWQVSIFPTNYYKNCLISCPYLESARKMHQNKYKQAYVWCSGSWDNIQILHINVLSFKPVAKHWENFDEISNIPSLVSSATVPPSVSSDLCSVTEWRWCPTWWLWK